MVKIIELPRFRFIYNRVLPLVARLFLGTILVYASIDKIAYPRGFSNVVISYQILPPQIAILFAYILPWIELILGISLILGIYVYESSFTAALLLGIFMIAVGIRSSTGDIQGCGCFPEGSILSTNNLLLSLIRDGIMLASAVFLFIREKKEKHKRMSLISYKGT